MRLSDTFQCRLVEKEHSRSGLDQWRTKVVLTRYAIATEHQFYTDFQSQTYHFV